MGRTVANKCVASSSTSKRTIPMAVKVPKIVYDLVLLPHSTSVEEAEKIKEKLKAAIEVLMDLVPKRKVPPKATNHNLKKIKKYGKFSHYWSERSKMLYVKGNKKTWLRRRDDLLKKFARKHYNSCSMCSAIRVQMNTFIKAGKIFIKHFTVPVPPPEINFAKVDSESESE